MSRGQDWDDAPCGLLVLRADGVVEQANRTFLEWTGTTAEALVGQVALSSLLSVGGRIFWETHLFPLLAVEGRVDEVAVELKAPDGRRPVLLTAILREGRISVAVTGARDRQRYERELLGAREAAERAAGQLSALQSTTSALSRALGTDGVAGALLAAGVGPLGAAAATLWLAKDTGDLEVHGSAGEEVGTAQLPIGGMVLQARAPAPHGERVVVPLHGRRALRGVLSLAPRSAAGADPLDLEVLTAIGDQAGLALDRAHLYEQSASVARELQHSLLALDPPVDERFAVATVYRPGVEMLEVGGDWYDVFLVEDGVLGFVVGDVVGRGLAAASAMGQLRSAVRAIAGPGVGPARLLTRLDRFVETVEAARMATLAYAELDLATGDLTYACAGHPPPLLVPAHGAPELLWGGRSTPLGGFVQALERTEAQLRLQAHDRVLLCTDGLFERRDRELDEGLELLAATAADTASVALEQAVRTVTRTLLQDEQTRDDVCVLLLSWPGNEFERHLPADLVGLSDLRHELDGWLAHRDVAQAVRDDLVLATSEALANAAEHGSGLRPDEQVLLRVRLDDEREEAAEVVVAVADQGRWRTPASSHERGRGMTIMSALVDDVHVDETHGTTVVLRRRLGQEEQ